MEENITPLKVGIKYGGFLGLGLILLTLIGHYTGWQDLSRPDAGSNTILSIASILIGFGFTFMGIKFYKNYNEGLLTLGEGMSVSLFIGIFSGILGAIFMYIFVSYVSPEMIDAAMNSIDTDEMSEEEAEMTEQLARTMATPMVMATLNFIGSLIFALIYGLIASLILKRSA